MGGFIIPPHAHLAGLFGSPANQPASITLFPASPPCDTQDLLQQSLLSRTDCGVRCFGVTPSMPLMQIIPLFHWETAFNAPALYRWQSPATHTRRQH